MVEKLTGAARLIERYIEEGEIDGGALAVSVDGGTIVDWYAGNAGPELPSGPEVIWPMASISKLYTVAAVMALVEDGLLTLSTRLATILPRFDTEEFREIRLWHLLTHTSGMIYESPKMEQRLIDRIPLEEMVDEAFEYPLVAIPGTRFEYSDWGIALAGRVAETVSGVSLPDLVRQRVTEPGGLTETFFPLPEAYFDQCAYVRDNPAAGTEGDMYNSPYGRRLAHPAFGVWASVRDLLRFGLLFRDVVGDSFLSRATLQAMTRDQLNGGLVGRLVGIDLHQPQPWGLGFMVRGETLQLGFGELASPRAFGHPGASGCVLLVDPELDVALAFVSNRHANAEFERFLQREASITNAIITGLAR